MTYYEMAMREWGCKEHGEWKAEDIDWVPEPENEAELAEHERQDTFEEFARCCREEEDCPASLMMIHSVYNGSCPFSQLYNHIPCLRVKARDWEIASHIEGMLEHIGALECSVLD